MKRNRLLHVRAESVAQAFGDALMAQAEPMPPEERAAVEMRLRAAGFRRDEERRAALRGAGMDERQVAVAEALIASGWLLTIEGKNFIWSKA